MRTQFFAIIGDAPGAVYLPPRSDEARQRCLDAAEGVIIATGDLATAQVVLWRGGSGWKPAWEPATQHTQQIVMHMGDDYPLVVTRAEAEEVAERILPGVGLPRQFRNPETGDDLPLSGVNVDAANPNNSRWTQILDAERPNPEYPNKYLAKYRGKYMVTK